MKRILLLSVCMALSGMMKGNNVNILNVQILNYGPDSTFIQFDLSWDNSWRVLNGPGNFDGVWVFFKQYFAYYNSVFNLALSPDQSEDVLPPGLEVWRNEYGAMFYRSASNLGTGQVSFTGIKLLLQMGIPNNVDVHAFAVEMVYVPGVPVLNSYSPAMLFGDGDGTMESTNAFHYYMVPNLNGISYYPMAVDANGFDDDAIEDPFSFFVRADGADSLGVPAGISNPYFPTGSSFWCMKYEITQGAYRDFLNTLSLTAQTTRTASSPTSAMGTGALTTSGNYRNAIEIAAPSAGGQPAAYGCDANGNNVFDEPDDGEYLACNFLSWPDIAAWLDWAGLSPMTEIQYERASRGMNYFIIPTVLGEYAWGDSSIANSVLTITDPFEATELVSNASSQDGNAVYMAGMSNGPVRNGIFATASSNRVTSGASYYGIMELSGNLSESCVTVGNVAGRSFNKGKVLGMYSSARGDGFLDLSGNALVVHWPGCTSDPGIETDQDCLVINGMGTILRGGSFLSPKEELSIADRSQGQVPDTRESHVGGRGVLVLSMFED